MRTNGGHAVALKCSMKDIYGIDENEVLCYVCHNFFEFCYGVVYKYIGNYALYIGIGCAQPLLIPVVNDIKID